MGEICYLCARNIILLMLNFISVLMIFDYRGKCLWEGNSSWVAHVCTPYSALNYVLEDVYKHP